MELHSSPRTPSPHTSRLATNRTGTNSVRRGLRRSPRDLMRQFVSRSRLLCLDAVAVHGPSFRLSDARADALSLVCESDSYTPIPLFIGLHAHVNKKQRRIASLMQKNLRKVECEAFVQHLALQNLAGEAAVNLLLTRLAVGRSGDNGTRGG